MYLEKLGGFQFNNHPVEEEDDFISNLIDLTKYIFIFLFIEILDQYKVLSVFCTPSLSAKPNIIQEYFNIKYNLIETKLTFMI